MQSLNVQAVLAGIFESFDVTATYDKPNSRLQLEATLSAELVPTPKTPHRHRGGEGA